MRKARLKEMKESVSLGETEFEKLHKMLVRLLLTSVVCVAGPSPNGESLQI